MNTPLRTDAPQADSTPDPQADPALAEIRRRILAAEGATVRELIFHGSRAYGRHRDSSDYDIVVVVDDPVGDWAQRSLVLSSLFFDFPVDVDIQVFGWREFEASRTVPGTLPHPVDLNGRRIFRRSATSPADRA